MNKQTKIVLLSVALGSIFLLASCETSVNDLTQNPYTFNLYFSNEEMNPNIEDCGKVFPVERSVTSVDTIEIAALKELLLGPMMGEQNNGYSSFFSPGTLGALNEMTIENGVAVVDFNDIQTVIPNASSSCGSAEFLAELDSTLKQFPTITKVFYTINGDAETFYSWLQMSCPEDFTGCQAATE